MVRCAPEPHSVRSCAPRAYMPTPMGTAIAPAPDWTSRSYVCEPRVAVAHVQVYSMHKTL